MKIQIVIADDHQLFIDGIKSILSREIGISIAGEARNGLELINLVKKIAAPDVILTDIRMPVMDGISATRELLKYNPDLPILALSMYDQPGDIIEMIDAGARGYLIKNADKSEMIKAIYAMHLKKEYFSDRLRLLVDKHQSIIRNDQMPLTRREKEIIQLIARGRTSMQIAQELNISKLTVDTHRKNMLKKLHISNAAGLIKYAVHHYS